MNIAKVKEILKDEPKFRLKQVYQAVFSNYIESWQEASNLSMALREKLAQEAPLEIKAEILHSKNKKTIKAGIFLAGDMVETVLMRHADGRNTVCVSSQVGCPMGCIFCLTGKNGFKRNLDFHEMINQVLFFSRYLKKENQRVTNIVFMGMGEPFLNYQEVLKAVRFLNDSETFNIGARKISISTVGIVEGIKKLAGEKLQVNLAVSLHAPEDSLRSRIIPANKNNDIKSLLKTVSYYIKKTGRKVMIEYIMIAGLNDGVYFASCLAELLKKELPGLFMVNLISYNQTDYYEPSSPQKIKAFKKILEENRIEVIERFKFGHDIKAACGQLTGEKK